MLTPQEIEHQKELTRIYVPHFCAVGSNDVLINLDRVERVQRSLVWCKVGADGKLRRCFKDSNGKYEDGAQEVSCLDILFHPDDVGNANDVQLYGVEAEDAHMRIQSLCLNW